MWTACCGGGREQEPTRSPLPWTNDGRWTGVSDNSPSPSDAGSHNEETRMTIRVIRAKRLRSGYAQMHFEKPWCRVTLSDGRTDGKELGRTKISKQNTQEDVDIWNWSASVSLNRIELLRPTAILRFEISDTQDNDMYCIREFSGLDLKDLVNKKGTVKKALKLPGGASIPKRDGKAPSLHVGIVVTPNPFTLRDDRLMHSPSVVSSALALRNKMSRRNEKSSAINVNETAKTRLTEQSIHKVEKNTTSVPVIQSNHSIGSKTELVATNNSDVSMPPNSPDQHASPRSFSALSDSTTSNGDLQQQQSSVLSKNIETTSHNPPETKTEIQLLEDKLAALKSKSKSSAQMFLPSSTVKQTSNESDTMSMNGPALLPPPSATHPELKSDPSDNKHERTRRASMNGPPLPPPSAPQPELVSLGSHVSEKIKHVAKNTKTIPIHEANEYDGPRHELFDDCEEFIFELPAKEPWGFKLHFFQANHVMRIESIKPGSPAEDAGMKIGDYIDEVGGDPLHEGGEKKAMQFIKDHKLIEAYFVEVVVMREIHEDINLESMERVLTKHNSTPPSATHPELKNDPSDNKHERTRRASMNGSPLPPPSAPQPELVSLGSHVSEKITKVLRQSSIPRNMDHALRSFSSGDRKGKIQITFFVSACKKAVAPNATQMFFAKKDLTASFSRFFNLAIDYFDRCCAASHVHHVTHVEADATVNSRISNFQDIEGYDKLLIVVRACQLMLFKNEKERSNMQEITMLKVRASIASFHEVLRVYTLLITRRVQIAIWEKQYGFASALLRRLWLDVGIARDAMIKKEDIVETDYIYNYLEKICLQCGEWRATESEELLSVFMKDEHKLIKHVAKNTKTIPIHEANEYGGPRHELFDDCEEFIFELPAKEPWGFKLHFFQANHVMRIESIKPGSPAEDAGMKIGDYIDEVGGDPLHEGGEKKAMKFIKDHKLVEAYFVEVVVMREIHEDINLESMERVLTKHNSKHFSKSEK